MNRIQRSIGAAALLISASHATLAVAQTALPSPPIRSPIDDNGVNLATGDPSYGNTDITIGTEDSGLAQSRFWSAVGWRHSFMGSVQDSNGIANVVIGGSTSTFANDNGSYTSKQRDGSTLSATATAYTFTSGDGTVIMFDKVSTSDSFGLDYGVIAGIARSITKPSGEVVSFFYNAATALYNQCDEYGACSSGSYTIHRLQSAKSSNGFQLKYEYATNDPAYAQNNPNSDQQTWFRIAKITAINNAVDYCDPMGDICAGLTQAWPFVSYGRTIEGNTSSNNVYADTVSDNVGLTKTYRYAYANNLAFSIRSASNVDLLTYTRGPGGYISTVTKAGATWNYSWSTSGSTRTVTRTDPLGHQRTVVSDIPQGVITSDTDELGHVTTAGYDLSGRLVSQIGSDGVRVDIIRDARGNAMQTITTSNNGTGATSTYASFDPNCSNQKICNKPTSITDAASQTTNFAYDGAHGGLLSVTRPAPTLGAVRPEMRYGYTPIYAYAKDSGSNIVASAAPIYKLTGISSCATAASCAGTADEIKTSLAYGAPGTPNNLFQTASTSGSGDGVLAATTSVSYDVRGNRTSIDGTLPGSADTTRLLYDVGSRVAQVVSPDPDGGGGLANRSVVYGYDAEDQVTSVVQGTANADGSGFAELTRTATSYDVYGRKMSDALVQGGGTQAVTQYSYDGEGRSDCTAVRMDPATFGSLPASACTATQAGGFGPDRIGRTVYDAADNPIVTQSALGTSQAQNTANVTIGADGKLASVADANGNVTSYGYDGFGRLSLTRYPNTSGGGSSGSDYEQLGYDANGNVTSRRLRDGNQMAFTFDALGRLTYADTPNLTTDDQDTSFAYDNLGRLTLAAKNPINQTHFIWDALGRKTGESNYYYSLTSGYDLSGQRTQLTWNDGFFVTYDYLLTGEMTGVREYGAGVLASFGYDNLGRRTSLSRGDGTVSTYGYDAASRLASLIDDLPGSAQDVTTTLAWSPAAQIVTKNRSNPAYAWAAAASSEAYASNGLNQYTQAGALTLGYDGRGNLTSAGGVGYQYSSTNRLAAASGNVLYADSLDRLDYISAEGVLLADDGDDVVTEVACCGTSIARRYVFGPGEDEPLLWYEGAGTGDKRYLHADERGSIVAVSSASGTTINTYDEYGVPGTNNIGRFQYTGQKWIPSLGMSDYKARTYSPTLGRFMQADPIGYAGGMNLYAYAGNDPASTIDPSGMKDVLVQSCRLGSNLIGFTDSGGFICERPDGGIGFAPPQPTGGRTPRSRPVRPAMKTAVNLGMLQKEKPKPAPVDYCGSAGSEGVPDGIWGGACKKHDDCYGAPGNSKGGCDVKLGIDIIDECSRRSYGVGAAWCVNVGLVYSSGLLLLGVTPWYHPSRDAYDAAQNPRARGR